MMQIYKTTWVRLYKGIHICFSKYDSFTDIYFKRDRGTLRPRHPVRQTFVFVLTAIFFSGNGNPRKDANSPHLVPTASNVKRVRAESTHPFLSNTKALIKKKVNVYKHFASNDAISWKLYTSSCSWKPNNSWGQRGKCSGWPAISDRRLEELDQFLWVCGVGPGRRHHLSRPQEGHLQGHGVVVEDQHLVLLLPQILQSHLGTEGRTVKGFSKDFFLNW